jgi:hypothetical protein
MAIKQYCDLCDELIPDSEEVFGLRGVENNRHSHEREDFSIAGKWHPRDFHHGMLCGKCYRRIRSLVLELAGEL